MPLVDLNFTLIPGDKVTDTQLKTCATLFSQNYGVWSSLASSPFKPGVHLLSSIYLRSSSYRSCLGTRVKMNANRLREQCFSDPTNSKLALCTLDGVLIGHAFATIWQYNGIAFPFLQVHTDTIFRVKRMLGYTIGCVIRTSWTWDRHRLASSLARTWRQVYCIWPCLFSSRCLCGTVQARTYVSRLHFFDLQLILAKFFSALDANLRKLDLDFIKACAQMIISTLPPSPIWRTPNSMALYSRTVLTGLWVLWIQNFLSIMTSHSKLWNAGRNARIWRGHWVDSQRATSFYALSHPNKIVIHSCHFHSDVFPCRKWNHLPAGCSQ